MANAADHLAPLMTDETAVVTIQNGLPWWYFDGITSPYAGERLSSVDPGDRIRQAIETRRVVGGVVAAIASYVSEPGVVHQSGAGAIVLGEIDGTESARCRDLAAFLEGAGVKASVTPNIRGEIWTKVWGNVSFSAIAVLTGSTLSALFEPK